MGLRFRKSLKIAPGVRLNFGKKSTSFSFGGKGARYTVSSTGRKTASVGIPGTGLSYVETFGGKKKRKGKSNMATKSEATPNGAKDEKPLYKKWGLWLVMLLLTVSLFSMGDKANTDTQQNEDNISSVENQEGQIDTEQNGNVVNGNPIIDQIVKPEAAVQDYNVDKKPPVQTEDVNDNTTTKQETEQETEQETQAPAEEPNVEPPVVEEPKVEEPKTEEPKVEEPVVVTPVPEEPVVETPPVVEPEPAPAPEPTGTDYVLNANPERMRFHTPLCSSVKTIKDEHRVFFTGTRDELISMGYVPCGRCKP